MKLYALILTAIVIAATPGGAAPIVFKSVAVQLPNDSDEFTGPGADAINGGCTGCHSIEMILNQPAMTDAAWRAEIAKMINAYKAPVLTSNIPAILAYLDRTKGRK